MTNREDKVMGCLIILSVVFAVSIIIGLIIFVVWSISMDLQTEYLTAKITKLTIENGETHFVVEHSDGTTEVLQNEDSFLRGKFNSSDILMNLEVDKTYRFKLNRQRIRFLSMYRNILDAKELHFDGSSE